MPWNWPLPLATGGIVRSEGNRCITITAQNGSGEEGLVTQCIAAPAIVTGPPNRSLHYLLPG